jgi:hypothetical protein
MNYNFEVLSGEIWNQFGAALDMLENALIKCPDELWNKDDFKFWYIAYHTLFFTDYYLTEEPEKFAPPSPFTLSELEEDGRLPERIYTKKELISYTNYCREKCRALLSDFKPDRAAKRWINKWKNYSIFEITLDNIRHVQHHTGQLNLLLGRINQELPIWVGRTEVDLK